MDSTQTEESIMEGLLWPPTHNADTKREEGHGFQHSSSMQIGTRRCSPCASNMQRAARPVDGWMDRSGELPRDQADFARWWSALWNNNSMDKLEAIVGLCWSTWNSIGLE